MRKILVCVVIIIFLFSLMQALGEEVKKKEKDIYALSYLGGYKCYTAMAGIVGMKERLNFINGYKSGFTGALMIDINESVFDKGFQDARNRYPSKYKEDILKDTNE